MTSAIGVSESALKIGLNLPCVNGCGESIREPQDLEVGTRFCDRYDLAATTQNPGYLQGPASKSRKSRVENIRTNSIRGHDNFNIFRRLEAIQLVEQLQHRPLHLRITAPTPALPS